MKKLLAVIVSIMLVGIMLVGCGEIDYNGEKFETIKANVLSYYTTEEKDVDVVPMLGTGFNSNGNTGLNVGYAYKNNTKSVYVFTTKELGDVKIKGDSLRIYNGEDIEEDYIIYHKSKDWLLNDMVEWHRKKGTE